MKRSEFIQAIRGDLARADFEWLHRNTESVDYHTKVDLLAKFILSACERHGMTPPVDRENFLELVMSQIKEEHRENHGYDIGAKRSYYAKRGAVLALKTDWDEE